MSHSCVSCVRMWQFDNMEKHNQQNLKFDFCNNLCFVFFSPALLQIKMLNQNTTNALKGKHEHFRYP